MAVVRALILLALVASAGCFAFYVFTADKRWRRRGLIILTGTLVAAFGFFAVLIIERIR